MLSSDYAKIFYTLLPKGPLWPEQVGEADNWDSLARAATYELARVDEQALELINEAIPDADSYAYPAELLESWERVAGLPDEFTPETQTDEERVQALIAKLRGPGSPTLAKFENLVDALNASNATFDGYRLVDSFQQASGGAAVVGSAGASVTYNCETDRDGALTAERVLLPTTAAVATLTLLRIANFEAVFIELDLKLVGGASDQFYLKVAGRDGVLKLTETITITNTWRRYTAIVLDVGTGSYDPLVQLWLVGGTNATVLIANAYGGWRERYYAIDSAGSVVGDSPGESWAHVFGVEYGVDITNRSAGKVAWATYNLTVANNVVTEPVSRQQLAYSLTPTGAYGIGILPTAKKRYVRCSMWLRVAGSDYMISITAHNLHGDLINTDVLLLTDDWQKYEIEVDNGTVGSSSPALYFVVDSGTVLYVGHVRASEIDSQLEGRVGAGVPLHTIPSFHSYGEFTQCTE